MNDTVEKASRHRISLAWLLMATAGCGIVHIGRHVAGASPGDVIEYGNQGTVIAHVYPVRPVVV